MFAVRGHDLPVEFDLGHGVQPPRDQVDLGPSTGVQLNVVSYRQSTSDTQVTRRSPSSTYGSGISPAASRPRWTQPGTVAGTARSPMCSGRSPPTADRVQPSRMGAITASPLTGWLPR